jgi:uncharacterized membrane protein
MSGPSKEPGFDRDSVEFGRVLAFSDGLFAIAMTLLIVAVTVPELIDKNSVHELADRLDDLSQSFISFFISFAVIGRYWYAHHQFVSLLQRMDPALIGINLVYLAFVAFLPFPTDLLGTYFDNPLAVAIYAVNVALISGFEVVLFRHAHRAGLLRRPLPEDVFRWGAMLSTAPLFFFLLSIPVAFLAGSGWAVLVWFGSLPFQAVANRWKPEGADELLRA